jgi:DnaK suppressor protein
MADPAPGTALQRAQAWLIQREAELAAEVRAAEHAVEASDGVHDLKDDAENAADAELHDAEVRRDLDELTAVRAALQRLEAGQYGVCEACGADIDPLRLEAQPMAARCLACQSKLEATGGPHRGGSRP